MAPQGSSSAYDSCKNNTKLRSACSGHNRRPYDTWPRAWGSPREKDTQWAARDHRGNLREIRDFKALMRDNLNTRDT